MFSNIYEILNKIRSKADRSALASDLDNTNKVLEGHTHPAPPPIVTGNLTAGSSKVVIGGTGTGAVIGSGASVDVVPGNIAHNDLGSKQGTGPEYNHLTNSQVAQVDNILLPVLSFYDPTSSTPASPSVGNRYISLATANGWTVDNIYEWNGSSWTEIVPSNGESVYVRYLYWTYTYNYAWLTNPLYWSRPILGIYDNTSGLPTHLVDGDTYIAKTTAHGWSKDYIYTWTWNVWRETMPYEGMVVFNLLTNTIYAYIDLVGVTSWQDMSAIVAIHDLAGTQHNADTITNLNLKLSDGDVISTKSAEISALTEKTVPVNDDILLMEDSAASNAKKKVKISSLPVTIHGIADSTKHSAAGITTGRILKADSNGLPTNSRILETSNGEAINNPSSGSEAYVSLCDGGFEKIWLSKEGVTNDFLITLGDGVGAVFRAKIADGTVKLPKLTTNGLVKTSNSDGSLSIASSADLPAHDLAGTQHNSDTITNLNLKLSDGDVISTKSGEINAFSSKTPVDADVILIEDSADSFSKKKTTVSNLMSSSLSHQQVMSRVFLG